MELKPGKKLTRDLMSVRLLVPKKVIENFFIFQIQSNEN